MIHVILFMTEGTDMETEGERLSKCPKHTILVNGKKYETTIDLVH